jgi:hypothetical protein
MARNTAVIGITGLCEVRRSTMVAAGVPDFGRVGAVQQMFPFWTAPESGHESVTECVLALTLLRIAQRIESET